MTEDRVLMDTVLLYKQTGELEEHSLSAELTNKMRKELIGNLIDGKQCGCSFPECGVTVFVKCDGDVDVDGMNYAATTLCGVLVVGDAVIVDNITLEKWNGCLTEGPDESDEADPTITDAPDTGK